MQPQKQKLNTALIASTCKLGRLVAVTFSGISMFMLVFNYGINLISKVRLFKKCGRLKTLQNKTKQKKSFSSVTFSHLTFTFLPP